MTRALTVRDLTVTGAEPVILDSVLAERLGFDRVRKIRELIRRNMDELEVYGRVSPHGGAKPPKGSQGGRPEEGFYLNEPQALLICMFSRTEKAAEVRRQVIGVFMAWRRDELKARGPVKAEPVLRQQEVLRGVIAHQQFMDSETSCRALAHLWPAGRKPKFWGDFEVRRALIVNHRQMTIEQLRRQLVTEVGVKRVPSPSAIHRFWQWLDSLRRPGRKLEAVQ
jgi:prophage antirepressor-like protein